MISLKEKLSAALYGACDAVVFGYPRDFTALPLICWRESNNRRYAQADGEEHLAELEYSIDCFAPSPEEASALHAAADERMRALGLRREALADVFEQNSAVYHISARYRALADGAGNIYQ